MPLKDLINRIDNFVLNVVPDHNVGYETKRDMADALLREAETAYAGQPLDIRNLLGERIEHLKEIRMRWHKQEASVVPDITIGQKILEEAKAWLKLESSSSLERLDKVARTRKYYENLRYYATGLPEAQTVMVQLEDLLQRLGEPDITRFRLSGPVQPNPPTRPQPLVLAKRFREAMTAMSFNTEAALNNAISKTIAEINKLEIYRSTLGHGEYELWGSQAVDEISKLSALVGEWNDQLGNIKRKEGLARTWRWQEDRDRERTRGYVEHKTSEIAKGQQKIEAAKVLREATNELEKAFSLCQMLMSKAHTLATPDIIPIDKMDASIRTFEGILSGLSGRLTEGEIREATRFLNRAKAYRSEMAKSLTTLGYDSGLRTYETTRASEGLRYFQANLDEIVREILSARTIKQLENLASSGINGAREAIAQAIIMAGKQNPDRMRAYIMGR